MIKHFCDICGREVVEGCEVEVSFGGKDDYLYELCDECEEKMRAIWEHVGAVVEKYEELVGEK